MNDQERQVIDDIFRRLEQAANQPRDPEAERYIADRIRQQPYAPYVMAQSLYVQEQALERLQAQIQELQAELQQRPQQSGGFLSSIFGGAAPRQPEPSRPSPWGQAAQQPGYGQGGGYPPGYNQPGYGQPGPQGGWSGPQGGPWSGAQPRMGGGFLGSALTTAAGVAGGMMLANALGNAFKGGHETLGSLAGGNLGALGADTAAGDGTLSGITDSLYGNDSSGQDASFQDASFDPDGGFDQDDLGGGSDDDSWT